MESSGGGASNHEASPAFWIVPEEVEKRVLLILIWPDSALSRRVAEAESILTEPVVWA